jgi:hypothetical protein
LDLSNNPDLKWVRCADNELTSLDLSKNPDLNLMDARSNPNLYCIQVMDSSDAANNPLWYKDFSAVYSEDCSSVSVNDNAIESNDISLSPNPASDYIEINLNNVILSEAKDLKIYNALGECVMSVGAIHEPIDRRSQLPLQLDISQLQPGVYFVRIDNKVSKFIKI